MSKDPVWRNLMLHPYVPHRVYAMPEDVYAAWSLLPAWVSHASDPHFPSPAYHLLIPDRLKALRNMLVRRPLASAARMVEWGHAVSDADSARLELSQERISVNKTLRRHRAAIRQKEQQQTQRRNVNYAAKVERTARLLAAQDRLKALFSGEEGGQVAANPALLASSPLAGVRVGNSTSSKLNYILNEVSARW